VGTKSDNVILKHKLPRKLWGVGNRIEVQEFHIKRFYIMCLISYARSVNVAITGKSTQEDQLVQSSKERRTKMEES